jgi:hypothetical protein
MSSREHADQWKRRRRCRACKTSWLGGRVVLRHAVAGYKTSATKIHSAKAQSVSVKECPCGLDGNPAVNSCLSPHPLGDTRIGIHSTSHTSVRSMSGHCARTRLRVLARSSSGVRASFFSIIESLSRSCMHPGERTRCSCSASDSSRCLCLGFALHESATIAFRRATSAGRSASDIC